MPIFKCRTPFVMNSTNEYLRYIISIILFSSHFIMQPLDQSTAAIDQKDVQIVTEGTRKLMRDCPSSFYRAEWAHEEAEKILQALVTGDRTAAGLAAARLLDQLQMLENDLQGEARLPVPRLLQQTVEKLAAASADIRMATLRVLGVVDPSYESW